MINVENKTPKRFELSFVTKILIVDDEPQVRELLAELILNFGSFHIDQASNGQEALILMKKNKYDLVFTDLIMPVMDGITLFRNIKTYPELYSSTFLVVISGGMKNFGISSEQFSKIRNEADAYLSKPFKESALQDVLQRASSYIKNGTAA